MSPDKKAKALIASEEISIAIVGSRSFNSFEQLTIMDEFIKAKVSCIEKVKKVVSGGADGADTLGKMWANANNIEIVEFIPDWKNYGKRAGMIRNHAIIDAADVVFAFWDGRSNGTRHSIKLAKEQNKELYIYIEHSYE